MKSEEYKSPLRDAEKSVRLGKMSSIRAYGKCVYGDVNDRGIASGGYFALEDTEKCTLLLSAKAHKDAKNGIKGAKLACKAVSLLISFYEKIYENNDLFINEITSSEFSYNLNKLWQKMILAEIEGKKAELIREEKEKRERKAPWYLFLNEKEEAKSQEEIAREEFEILSSIPREEISDYCASVSFALIDDKRYALYSSADFTFALYNEIECSKLSLNEDKATYLGDNDFSLEYAFRPRQDYAGATILTSALANIIGDSIHKYTLYLEKEFIKGYGNKNPFILENEREAILKNLKDEGAIVVSSFDTKFVLPEEKYKAYQQEIFRKRREEMEKSKQAESQKKIEESKDKSSYDTYDMSIYDGFEQIQVFSARKQGRSHIDTKTPCQDYCLSAGVSKGVILADADGVGSCSQSGTGSKLACEAVVNVVTRLDAQSNSEEQFVSRLQNIVFREKILSTWRETVFNHIREVNPDKRQITIKDLSEYATTLMFAVITENYYVVGCLGDGQVLLYNDSEAVKLRLHSPKSDTKTNALVKPNCFREDFIVEKYKRSEFSSVLLTTDGMYDPLSKGEVLYQYCKQAQERFLKMGEPYQPFCFQPENEAFRDIFSTNTMDDCSIALAVDTSFKSSDNGARFNAVAEKHNITFTERIGDKSIYASKDESGEYYTVLSKEEAEIPQISGVRIIKPITSYQSSGYFCNVYRYTETPSLEKLYHYGILREQGETAPNASRFILKVYEDLLECIAKIEKSGYNLNQDSAHTLMLYDSEEGFILYPEAIVKHNDNEKYDNKKVLSYFDSLLGKLICNGISYPLFKIDYTNIGLAKYLSQSTDGPIGVLVREGGDLYLENRGSCMWYDKNDSIIGYGKRIPLENGALFKVTGFMGYNRYEYIPKECF